MTRIAILMASFEGAPWIAEQLRSILGQEDVDTHVILSDDGSTDGTVEVARETAGDRLTLLPPGRTGSAARNFLRLIADADWSDFDYVALADQDDIWAPGKLSRAVARLSATGAAAYASDVTAFWPDGRRSYIRKSQPQRRWDHLFEAGGPGCTFVWPRAEADWLRARLAAADPAALARVGFHDWLIYALFREAGKGWLIDPVSGLDYRQHAENALGAARGAAALKRRSAMARGGWYREQILLLAGITGATNPVLDYVRSPHPSRLGVPLRHVRACRRREIEALMLLAALVSMAWGRSRQH